MVLFVQVGFQEWYDTRSIHSTIACHRARCFTTRSSHLRMKQANARLRAMLGFGTTEFVERKKEPGAVFVSKLVCIAMRFVQTKTARHLDKSVFMHGLLPPAELELDQMLQSSSHLLPRTISFFDEQSCPRSMWYVLGRSLYGFVACFRLLTRCFPPFHTGPSDLPHPST